MAWYKRYSVPFVSFNSTSYEVAIYEQINGGVTVLKGAAEPFVTQEIDSDDIFTPIRGQTGTLRVIDDTADGMLLETLIPTNNTQRLVQLRDGGGVIRWQGFMCAEAFTQPWDGEEKVVEFPLKSTLMAMDDVQMPSSGLSNEPCIAAVFVEAADALSAWFDTLTVIADTSIRLLELLVQRPVFLEEKEINNEGDRTKIIVGRSYLSAISDILSLFGLMAREDGVNLYLTQYDHPNTMCKIFSIMWSQVVGMAGGQPTPIPSPDNLQDDDLVSSVEFAGSDNVAGYIQGGRSAEVVLDIADNRQEISLPQTTEDSSYVYELPVYDDRRVYGQPHQPRGGVETFSFFSYHRWNYDGMSSYANFLPKTRLAGYLENPYYSDSNEFVTGACPVRWYYRKQNTDIVQLRNGILMNSQYRTSGQSGNPTKNNCYSIKSSVPFLMTDGYININFNVNLFLSANIGSQMQTMFGDPSSYLGESVTTEMACALRVGNKYWDGTNWVANSSPLTTYFWLQFDDGILRTNKDATMLVDKTGGYFVPISDTNDVVEFHILNVAYVWKGGNSPIYQYSYTKIISDLSVQFVPKRGITTSDRSNNTYRQEILMSGFSDDKSIGLTVGTMNNNVVSPSFLKRDANTYVESLYYGVSEGSYIEQRPELHLLARMAAHYGVVRRTFTGVVATGLDLMCKCYTYIGRRFFGVVSQCDWRDDREMVKFIEIS